MICLHFLLLSSTILHFFISLNVLLYSCELNFLTCSHNLSKIHYLEMTNTTTSNGVKLINDSAICMNVSWLFSFMLMHFNQHELVSGKGRNRKKEKEGRKIYWIGKRRGRQEERNNQYGIERKRERKKKKAFVKDLEKDGNISIGERERKDKRRGNVGKREGVIKPTVIVET